MIGGKLSTSLFINVFKRKHDDAIPLGILVLGNPAPR
jgi:hypothetical protein